MSRLLAALLAVSILLPAGARAQATAAPAKKKDSPPAQPDAIAQAQPSSGAAAPGTSQQPATPAQPTLDPATRDLVRREVEKAKEEMRDEMRAEIQGAQSAREFMETTAAGERPKLDFLQLNGYLRVRGDLFDNLDLHRAADPSGYYLFPRPLRDPDNRGTLTSANMRFRLEPTLNVSEQVRVLAQIDMLDNIVLGSTPQGLFAHSEAVASPFDARTQVPPANGVNADRNSIEVKRAWAEVQTPVGLLSFGRMPSSWGLGILSHAGSGVDDDLGDTVDRLQFALTPLKTPLGQLVLVPMYEIVATGVTSQDLRTGRGLGQPFDRDPADDAKAIGLKVVRMDTDEEVKRKLERDEASVSFGAWYMYKSQTYEFPQWVNGGATPTGSTTTPAANPTSPPSTGQSNDANNDAVGPAVRRDAYAHTLDLWGRYQSRRFRFEAEIAGLYGQIGNTVIDPTGAAIGPVLLRQWGGAAQAGWKLADGKFTLGGEVGFASGDSNPGFGNRPGRGCTIAPEAGTSVSRVTCTTPQAGDIDGPQFARGDNVLDIRNFRFNPAYRVDLILWREILQGVTDAFYLKPTARYELIEGLAAQASLVYSQAFYGTSTPSSSATFGGHKPLGIELDVGLSYQSDDGFIAFANYGLLQPLDGLGYAPNANPLGRDTTRAHAIRTGLAVKF